MDSIGYWPTAYSAGQLPPSLALAALAEASARDAVTARRLVLLALLWHEGYQSQDRLIARAAARLGHQCFGKARALTFRRDMQAVKAILAAAGQRLRYSRQPSRPGYYLSGRPGLDPAILKAIRGAVEEVDLRQMEVFARMTPAQRLRLATRLSDELLHLAVARLQQERPELARSAAQREVLHRYYQVSR